MAAVLLCVELDEKTAIHSRAALGSYGFLELRADHNAAMRLRKAFGFSANRRPASRCADFKCASRRAVIIGDSLDRQGATGWCGVVKLASTARSWQEPS